MYIVARVVVVDSSVERVGHVRKRKVTSPSVANLVNHLPINNRLCRLNIYLYTVYCSWLPDIFEMTRLSMMPIRVLLSKLELTIEWHDRSGFGKW